MSLEKDFMARVFSFLGGLSGLLSIALIIWKGGVLWQMVGDHERRINVVETSGSRRLGEHEREDDQRVNDMRQRITHQEDIGARVMDGLADIRGDVKVIKATLDDMKAKMNGNGNHTP